MDMLSGRSREHIRKQSSELACTFACAISSARVLLSATLDPVSLEYVLPPRIHLASDIPWQVRLASSEPQQDEAGFGRECVYPRPVAVMPDPIEHCADPNLARRQEQGKPSK